MKIHFVALGCPKNLVDSEVMLAKLLEKGCTLTEDPKDAEVAIVNTCAFVEDAKKEAIDELLSLAEYKKNGDLSLIVAAGCLPQRYEGDLAKLIPEIDIFVGTGEFHRIADIVWEWAGKQRMEIGKPTYIYDHLTPRLHTTPKHIGYLKIAEGCFHPCSFCIIPKIRGKFRSRPMDSIVEEASGILSRGVREINLIAQDTTSYGKDIGADLATLLGEIANLEGEKWIRLLYAYPHSFPGRVVDALRDYDDICKYVDVPIQHISDRVLKRMGREGGSEEVRALIDVLRREIPGVSLRTSLIVGYPGETQHDFDELVDFVSEARFENLGVFVFSPEEGTKAFKLKGRVAREIAEMRRDEIMGLQREISLSNNMKHLGRRMTVMVDGASDEPNMVMEARHEGQAPEIDGLVYIKNGIAAAGDFVTVEITDAKEYDLVGKIIS